MKPGGTGVARVPPKGTPPGNPVTPTAQRSNVPPVTERRLVPDEVVFEVAGDPAQPVIDAIVRRFNLAFLARQNFGAFNSTLVRGRILDGQTPRQKSIQMGGDRGIAFVEPNYVFVGNENAPAEGDAAQYALAKLHLPEAHALAKGDKVLVAVVDSRIDTAHPELAGTIAEEFDAVDTPGPPHPHGTAIAGIIASHQKLMGAAPAASILAVRALSGDPASPAQGTGFDILRALDWTRQKGARVVNMSFAGPPDPLMGRAIGALRQKGMILVAAVGNAGPNSPPLYPASDQAVIGVTATGPDDKLYDMANRGGQVAVAAPGVGILVPAPDAQYRVGSGTSFAAAYVSGVAALLIERNPSLDPDGVRKALMTTARDLGPKGRDDQFGAGLTDALKAVQAVTSGAAAAAERR